MKTTTSAKIRIVSGVIAIIVGIICMFGQNSNARLSIECVVVGLLLIISTCFSSGKDGR